MPMVGEQSSERHPRARPPGSFLERQPGARLATLVFAVALVIGVVTLLAWLPTQTEICAADEPDLAACRNVAPAVVVTAVTGIPSAVALTLMAVRDRRHGSLR